jgi:hypothetical protein
VIDQGHFAVIDPGDSIETDLDGLTEADWYDSVEPVGDESKMAGQNDLAELGSVWIVEGVAVTAEAGVETAEDEVGYFLKARDMSVNVSEQYNYGAESNNGTRSNPADSVAAMSTLPAKWLRSCDETT